MGDVCPYDKIINIKNNKTMKKTKKIYNDAKRVKNVNENVIFDENTFAVSLLPNQINYMHIIFTVRYHLQKQLDDLNKRTNQNLFFNPRPETNELIIDIYEKGKKIRPDWNDAELCYLVVETIKRLNKINAKQCA